MPELFVIVEVFIPQSQRHHPLQEKFLDGEFDEFFVPMIGETPGKLPDDAEPVLDFPQEQPARIGGDGSAIKIGHDFASSVRLKQKALSVTLCHDETFLFCV